MGWLVAFVVVGVVLAIAAVLVGREAGRMTDDPPAAVFDPDDAHAWVIAHLPDLVAATLTEADVRRILDFQLEFLRRKGVSANGTTPAPRGPVIFGTGETVDYIVARSRETGEEYIPEQVEGVIATQLEYLRAIGAIGRAATPDEASSEGPPEIPPS